MCLTQFSEYLPRVTEYHQVENKSQNDASSVNSCVRTKVLTIFHRTGRSITDPVAFLPVDSRLAIQGK